MKKRLLKDSIGVALTVTLVLLFAFPLLSDRAVTVRGDIAAQFLSWEVSVRQAFEQGRLPLWNPGALGGYPLLANLQSSPLYPLDLALLPFDVLRHFSLSLALHLLIAGLGVYLLSRRLNTSAQGACLASVAFALSGFTMIHLPFGNHLTVVGASWTPWVFLGAVWTVRRPGATALCITAGSIALQILAGHPQLLVYAAAFSTLFVLLAAPWQGDLRRASRILGLWVAGGALAGLLAAAQLLPVLEWIPFTARDRALDFAQATEFGFAPHRLIALILPDFFGSHISRTHPHWDHFAYWSNAYIGGLTVLLAVAALWNRRIRSRERWALVATLAVAMICACGRDNYLYYLVLHLPGFKHFRAPAKFLPIVMLTLALAGGLGLDALQRGDFKKRWARILLWAVPALALLALWGWLAVCPDQKSGRVADLATSLLSRRWLFLFCGAGITLYLTRSSVTSGAASLRSVSLRSTVPWLLALTVGLDLIDYGRPWLSASLVDKGHASRLLYPEGEIRWLQREQKEDGYFLVASSSRAGHPNRYSIFGLANLSGYDPMAPQAAIDTVAQNEGDAPGQYRDDISITRVTAALAERGVRYAVLPANAESPPTEIAHEVEWEGKGPSTGRIFELTGWRADRFALRGLDPEDTCSVERFASGRFVLNTQVDKRATLTLPITYAPGWRLQIDEEVERRVETHHRGLLQIDLPAEARRVALTYAPPSVRLGLMVSAAGTLVWLSLCGLAWRDRRRHAPDTG